MNDSISSVCNYKKESGIDPASYVIFDTRAFLFKKYYVSISNTEAHTSKDLLVINIRLFHTKAWLMGKERKEDGEFKN